MSMSVQSVGLHNAYVKSNVAFGKGPNKKQLEITRDMLMDSVNRASGDPSVSTDAIKSFMKQLGEVLKQLVGLS